MPRCIECESEVSRLINPDTRTVERCPRCGRRCDTYYEFGEVQVWIDVFLMQRRAWMHILFNKAYTLLHCILQALIGCLFEATVARCLLLSPTDPRAAANGVGCVADGENTFAALTRVGSLQLVKIMSDPALDAVQFVNTLPRLFLNSSVEYALLLIVAVCVGKNLRRRGDRYEETLSRWVRAVSLSTATKVIYALFLIWQLPPSLLPVVDCIFYVTLTRGMLTLMAERPFWYALLGVILCGATRGAYRHWTGWNVQVMM